MENFEIIYIQKLTKAKNIIQGNNIEKPNQSSSFVTKDAKIYVPLVGLIDFNKEKERLNKELTNLNKEIEILNNKLKNENFIKNAPEEEINKVKEKYNIAMEKINKLNVNLKELTL